MPPLYDFICGNCGTVSEVYRSVANRHESPICCEQAMGRHYGNGFQVMPDIEPYKTVAADKETGKTLYITSRKQHREFLKRNNYEEVGNEKTPFFKRGE